MGRSSLIPGIQGILAVGDAVPPLPTLSGPRADWDAVTGQLTAVSPPLDNQEKITTWTESENSYAPTQGTDANRPIWDAAGYVTFDGNDQLDEATANMSGNGGPFSFHALVRASSGVSSHIGVFEHDARWTVWRASSGVLMFTRPGVADYAITGVSFPLNTWCVLQIQYDTTNSMLRGWVNNSEGMQHAITGITSGARKARVGVYNGASLPWDGDIKRIIVHEAIQSNEDREQTYLHLIGQV